MPLPIDYHNHPQAHCDTPYTLDLLQPWADSARAKGLSEVAFTDHDRYHTGVHFDQIDRLNEANPDLYFLAGIELDNDPVSGKAGRAWVEENWDRLDFVLGSAHYLPPDPEMFDKTTRGAEFAEKDMVAACTTYLAELNGMLDRSGVDCLSHLDLIKIHGNWQPAGGLLPYFQPLLERIRQDGLAIEISTAGWRKPVGEQYPGMEIIAAAADLGIPFTLASDAHSHAQLGEDYVRLEKILAALNVTEVATYRRHRRTMIPLRKSD